MTTHYLLPCTCGKKNEVDSGQAGLNIRCSCGAELAVPTMRGLDQLERAESPTSGRRQVAPPQSTWGARQALIFLGLVVLLGAALPAGLAWYSYPQPPRLRDDFEKLNRADIDPMTLMQAWDLWTHLRQDFSEETEIPEMHMYRILAKAARERLIFIGVVGGIGLLLVIAGLLIRPAGGREAV
ncbi:MAG TPA: hypothetical protein VGN42_08190 [Pirellulales bacterium]|jgi:hypothetical protein|nr:hypothetical protein [Pirellulales bacterium]